MRIGLMMSCALVAGLSVSAKADTTPFPIGGSGGTVSGSGTLYATANTTAEGSIVNYTITSLEVPGVTEVLPTGTFNGSDNLLFPSATPVLDSHGFSITDTQDDGSEYEVNLYADATSSTGYSAYVEDEDGDTLTLPVSLTLGAATSSEASSALHTAILADAAATTAFNFRFAATIPGADAAVTPEPSSFLLLGTGFLGVAGVLRRRFQA